MAISLSESYADVEKREIKAHGSVAFPATCYSVAFPETDIAWHWHEDMELILAFRGKVRVLAGTKKIILSEGMGVFINANILHTVEAENPIRGAHVHSVVFHPRLVGGDPEGICWEKYLFPLMRNMQYPIQIFSEQDKWQKKILEQIGKAWELIAEEKYGYEFRVRNELSEIILLLHGHQQDNSMPLSSRNRRNEQRMKHMLRFISEHYFEQILLEDIAKSASISKSECLRCFREMLGKSPIQYVNQYRLLMAAQYLKETDWQITEIGYRCGYTEMGYFSSQFKKRYGVNPTKYRGENTIAAESKKS